MSKIADMSDEDYDADQREMDTLKARDSVHICPECGFTTEWVHYEAGDKRSYGIETYLEYCPDCGWKGGA